MKTAIYFNELQPLLYGYYICKGVIFLHRKISAAVFTVLTAMSMCGCTSDKNTVGQSTGRNGRGGRTPAETAFLTDGSEKVCYGHTAEDSYSAKMTRQFALRLTRAMKTAVPEKYWIF